MLLPKPDSGDDVAQYFYNKTRELMESKSFSLTDKNLKNVDIVRDVLKNVPIYWAATQIVRS